MINVIFDDLVSIQCLGDPGVFQADSMSQLGAVTFHVLEPHEAVDHHIGKGKSIFYGLLACFEFLRFHFCVAFII